MNWLMLIHHIPPKPGYLRAKAAKRLAALGAVALKNAVYALPEQGSAREDLSWLAKEIEEGGGRAFVCRAEMLAGLHDAQVRVLFQEARDADYAALSAKALELLEQVRRLRLEDDASDAQAALARLRREDETLRAVDFFGAPGREALEGLLAGVDTALKALVGSDGGDAAQTDSLDRYQGCVWVTRTGVGVDRMASAWFIRRFVDPAARFRFVNADGYVPTAGEVRFDMLEAEFTHEGELCTFEALAKRLGAGDPALTAVAEVIHDLDLREERHGRPEAAGIGALLDGVCRREVDDARRVERAMEIFEDLLEFYRSIR